MRLFIQSERLVLRLPVPADAPAIARQIGVREVAFMLACVPYPYAPEMADDWLRRQAEDRRAGKGVAFAIAPREAPDTLLGNISLRRARRTGSNAELGYWLGTAHWGRGYMSEAARAAVAFGFGVWGLKSVSAGHFEENPASGRVLTKLGFTETGRGPMACAARNNAQVPHVDMILHAGDWWRGAGAANSL